MYLKAAVLLLVGAAAEEDAAVGLVGGLDLGGEEEVLQDGLGVVDAVSVGAGGGVGAGLPSAGVAELPGFPILYWFGLSREFFDLQVADLVFVEELGEVEVAFALLLRRQVGVLKAFVVLNYREVVGFESEFDLVPDVVSGLE